MYDRNSLKEKLTQIKENNFEVPGGTDVNCIVTAMLEYIGDNDPELRDSLIYTVFWHWIINGVLDDHVKKEILNSCLDNDHLFYNVGEQNTDSVFTRSFSVLVIAILVYAHRQHEYLSHEDVKRATERTIDYACKEKDVRGYTGDKGWAHSTAHTADLLDELAQCSENGVEDLIQILKVIKDKVYINYYAYINEEDERMSVAAASLMNRGLLDEANIISWIKGFENIERTGHFPEDHNLIMNVKGFLRSLYFRLRQECKNPSVVESLKDTIYKIRRF